MDIEELKKRCISESKMVLTEETVLDAFVYLYTGGSIDDYPNKEALEKVKDNFRKLAGC